MGILQGKATILTGASSGVGYGVALRFAEEGANIVACARRFENLERLRDDAKARGFSGKIIPQQCDVSVEADLDAVVKTAVDTFGTVEILANIAQTLSRHTELIDSTVEQAQILYATGPIASMLLMQKCFPYMKKQHYGRIINCSANSVVLGSEGLGAYSMAKGAINALTRNASQEWGQYGITTNVFLPIIKTEHFDKSDYGRQWAEKMGEENPMRYFGTPYEDCSPIVAFLASEAAGYINGQAISVSGGKVLLA
jgi:NAD(P)-dependent dehydrogenase (short-subunit alcohol dehydrogenase family)